VPGIGAWAQQNRDRVRRDANTTAEMQTTQAAQLVVPVPCPDDPPHDGILTVGFVVHARDDLLPTVAEHGAGSSVAAR
jgi:hypothetical protein